MTALTFSPKEKLAELSRELALRRNVYPKQVEDGRLRAENADRQIAVIEAIIRDYQGASANEWERHALAEALRKMGGEVLNPNYTSLCERAAQAVEREGR